MTKSTAVNTNSSDIWHTLSHIQQSVKNTVTSGCSKVATFAKEHPSEIAAGLFLTAGLIACIEAVNNLFNTFASSNELCTTKAGEFVDLQTSLKEKEAMYLDPEQRIDKFFILNDKILEREMVFLQRQAEREREAIARNLTNTERFLNTMCGRDWRSLLNIK